MITSCQRRVIIRYVFLLRLLTQITIACIFTQHQQKKNACSFFSSAFYVPSSPAEARVRTIFLKSEIYIS